MRVESVSFEQFVGWFVWAAGEQAVEKLISTPYLDRNLYRLLTQELLALYQGLSGSAPSAALEDPLLAEFDQTAWVNAIMDRFIAARRDYVSSASASSIPEVILLSEIRAQLNNLLAPVLKDLPLPTSVYPTLMGEGGIRLTWGGVAGVSLLVFPGEGGGEQQIRVVRSNYSRWVTPEVAAQYVGVATAAPTSWVGKFWDKYLSSPDYQQQMRLTARDRVFIDQTLLDLFRYEVREPTSVSFCSSRTPEEDRWVMHLQWGRSCHGVDIHLVLNRDQTLDIQTYVNGVLAQILSDRSVETLVRKL